MARGGPRTRHVLLASGVPYRRTCSSLGVVGLTFMILLVDGFKLSLKRILMCLLIQSKPDRAAYQLSASTDVRLRQFDQPRPLLALVVQDLLHIDVREAITVCCFRGLLVERLFRFILIIRLF